jgi:hypothetical protein
MGWVVRFVGLLVLGGTSLAMAQEQERQTPSDFAVVRKYLDEDSCVVAHLDFALFKLWSLETMQKNAADWLRMEVRPEFRLQLLKLQKLLVQSGASRAYVLAGNPARAMVVGPLLVIPAGDPEAARQTLVDAGVLQLLEGLVGPGNATARIDQSCVLLGDHAVVERALEHPDRGSEPLQRMAAMDGVLGVTFVPSSTLREIAEGMWNASVQAEPQRPRDFEPLLGLQSLVFSVRDMQGPVALDAAFERPEQAAKVAELLRAPLGQLFGAEANPLFPTARENLVVAKFELRPEVIALLARAQDALRGPAERAQDMNSMKQISLAMRNYETARKRLPPQALSDKYGRKLLSWRVLLLPYLGEQALYDQFHLDEPWDSPHNRTLIPRMPAVYRSASAVETVQGMTPFVAPLTKNSLMGRPGRSLTFQEVTDGTSSTVWLVRLPDAQIAVWTRPEDWRVPQENALSTLRQGDDSFLGARVDGSVQVFDGKLTNETFQGLLSVDGGDPIEGD